MMSSGALWKVLALVCFFQATGAWRKFNDLRVRTNAFGLPKSEAFYPIATSTNSPLLKDFVKVQPESNFKYEMDFYCKPKDPRFCVMYDKKGNVCGVQISILKTDAAHVKSEDYNYAGIREYAETNFFGIPAYSSRVYFTDPQKLTANGRKKTDETAEGLWMELGGKIVEVQRKEPTEPKMGDFDRQGCYPAMGQHYMYKYTKDSTCKEHYPIFPLYNQGGLAGVGVAFVGKQSKLETDWYEKPKSEAVKVILPNAPACSGEVAGKYGMWTMHVFLVDKPWEISCP